MEKSRLLGLRKTLSITTEQVAFKFKEARKKYTYLKPHDRDMRQALLSYIEDKPRVER